MSAFVLILVAGLNIVSANFSIMVAIVDCIIDPLVIVVNNAFVRTIERGSEIFVLLSHAVIPSEWHYVFCARCKLVIGELESDMTDQFVVRTRLIV